MARIRGKDPMLALIRTPLLSRIDRRLAAILGGSVVLHIGLAIYAWSTDIDESAPGRTPTAAIPIEYEEIDVTLPDFTPPEQVTNPTPAPGIATPVAPNQTPRSLVHRPTVRPAITTNGHIDPSQLDGLFSNTDAPSRRPTLDIATQIRDARDHHIEIGTNRDPDANNRDHLAIHDESPLTDNPTLTHVDPQHHEGLPARVVPGPVVPRQTTTLTPALVLELIQSQYMRGLQRCYSRGLASEGASLSGKVALEFTVGSTGDVTTHSASGVSPSVDACIESQMSTWRFPTPHDAHGNAIDAPFAITLALQPS